MITSASGMMWSEYFCIFHVLEEHFLWAGYLLGCSGCSLFCLAQPLLKPVNVFPIFHHQRLILWKQNLSYQCQILLCWIHSFYSSKKKKKLNTRETSELELFSPYNKSLRPNSWCTTENFQLKCDIIWLLQSINQSICRGSFTHFTTLKQDA